MSSSLIHIAIGILTIIVGGLVCLLVRDAVVTAPSDNQVGSEDPVESPKVRL